MLVILRKKCQHAHWRNEGGFTFAEMLIAFMAFCILMSFLPLGIKTVLSHEYLEQRIQRLEWEVFNSQIKKEIRLSSQVIVQNDKIFLQNNGETILYEKYGANIRRRVNFTGHEILLQNVASVQFKLLPEGFSILVFDLKGIEYQANIRSFIDVEIKE